MCAIAQRETLCEAQFSVMLPVQPEIINEISAHCYNEFAITVQAAHCLHLLINGVASCSNFEDEAARDLRQSLSHISTLMIATY